MLKRFIEGYTVFIHMLMLIEGQFEVLSSGFRVPCSGQAEPWAPQPIIKIILRFILQINLQINTKQYNLSILPVASSEQTLKFPLFQFE